MGRQSSLGFAFGNLAGVLTERGDLGAALAAAREALRPLSDNGYAWHFMDHFALRTGLAGHVEDAARLAGFADASFARHQATREPNEARARMRLHRLLEERLSTHTLVRLLAEGADAGEPEACRLAAIA